MVEKLLHLKFLLHPIQIFFFHLGVRMSLLLVKFCFGTTGRKDIR